MSKFSLRLDVLIFGQNLMISNFTNSSVDIVTKYLCIATDLYVRLYLYNIDISAFYFSLIYLYNNGEAN